MSPAPHEGAHQHAKKHKNKGGKLKTPVESMMDLENREGYSGTFRWAKSKELPPLPPSVTKSTNRASLTSWDSYLKSRSTGEDDLTALAESDLVMIDGLSFPLTILYGLKRIHRHPTSATPFHIIIMGATQKTEQRIWEGSNYFEEVGAYYKDCEIHLWFIGQEVKEVEKGRIVPVRKPNRDNMHVHMRRGTVKDFILKNVELKRFEAWRENSVVFGFNCGFGNFLETGRMELLWSWLPDLYLLSTLKLPTVFTCANDYADVPGEFMVHGNIIGSKFLLPPSKNPFAMASTFGSEEDLTAMKKGGHDNQNKDKSWSQGNLFLYAVSSYDNNRRIIIDTTKLEERQSKLTEAARKPLKPEDVLDFSLWYTDDLPPQVPKPPSSTPAPPPRSGPTPQPAPAKKDQSIPPPAAAATANKTSEKEAVTAARTDPMAIPKNQAIPPAGAITFLQDSQQEGGTLTISLLLPGVACGAEIELDLATCQIRCKAGGHTLNEDLPCLILPETATATFSKKACRVTVKAQKTIQRE